MSITQNYRDKHRELLELASQIIGLIEKKNIVDDAAEMRQILAILAGKLRVHLATEDRHLYPLLLAHDDGAVRQCAEEFISEMGDIYTHFTEYIDRWPNAISIEEKPGDFVTETLGMLKRLAERMEREDNKLYPLADKSTAPAQPLY